MSSLSFREYLNQKHNNGEPIFFDGGMGTMIQKSGAVGYEIPEDLNFFHPEIIKSIYSEYIKSGCNIITANSFGASPIKINETHHSHTAEQYIAKAIELAKETLEQCEKEDPSILQEPHYIAWDSGQIGKLLEPMGTLTFDQAYESYKEAAIAAEKSGADFALIETMSDLYECKAAILAVKENTSLPIVVSMTFQSNLRTLTGADVLTCVTYLESLRVDALGFNCGGNLAEDEELSRQYCEYASIPVLVQPNAGLPEVINGKDVYKVTPEEFSASQLKNRMCGATILGGCCGTTPAHIKALKEKVKDTRIDTARTLDNGRIKTDTYICSYNAALKIGGEAGPVIIGERINPTGKKKCKEALQNNDMKYILSEAESQIHSGAHILDVNVGLPGIDEAQMMCTAVKTIQAAFNIPLQIDSSESKVLERALRYYNGKALVNSVNGKQEEMDKVFPLIKHYGGSVVALCIDEDGIAPTAEGRVKVAEKIISEAAKYGIEPKDIFIDTLTLTVSSEQDHALETVRAIEILNTKYKNQGLRFVLGVSNISFGLPRRDIINSRFFMLALYAGLSACIINPASQGMMDTYNAYRSLGGFDKNCIDYIQRYTGTIDPTTAKAREEIITKALADGTIQVQIQTSFGANSGTIVQSAASSPVKETAKNQKENTEQNSNSATGEERQLIEIIEKGFKDQAALVTEQLLQTKEPVEIINNCIVPALDAVGKDFEKGKKFLPQLLLSADTVGCSFAKIKENLAASGIKEESKGTIAIATVYGDIHDIGKNIVKAMLENYGYTVIDLGKNVSAQTVVDTVINNDIKLVGLSALMTTTVANMEETIHQLRVALANNNKTCKIMVGGAVLTADYAQKIGADYYTKDAMESVAVAKEVFGK